MENTHNVDMSAPILAVIGGPSVKLHDATYDSVQAFEDDLRELARYGSEFDALLVTRHGADMLAEVAYAEVTRDDDGDWHVTPIA